MKRIIFSLAIFIVFLTGCLPIGTEVESILGDTVMFNIDLSDLNYVKNRELAENEFGNIIIKGPKLCINQLSKIVYPSIYKEYEEIEISTQEIEREGWVIYNIRAKDKSDINGSPLTNGVNYNDYYTIGTKYSKCEFELWDFGSITNPRLLIRFNAAELISDEIIRNHPNKELVAKFSNNISCSLSELSTRNVQPKEKSFQTVTFNEIKRSYPIFKESSELIYGSCHTQMEYPSYLSFDVAIDPNNGNTIASKDYKTVPIIPR